MYKSQQTGSNSFLSLIRYQYFVQQEYALCSLMKLLQAESNHPLRKSDTKRYAFPVDVLIVSMSFFKSV